MGCGERRPEVCKCSASRSFCDFDSWIRANIGLDAEINILWRGMLAGRLTLRLPSKVRTALAACTLLLAFGGEALGAEPDQPKPAEDPAAPGKPPQRPDDARRRPDDVRGLRQKPGTEPEDVALFVPRLVLTLPRMALRLVLFPIEKAMRFVDEHALIERIDEVLYNDERTAAIVPKLSIATFFGTSVGAKVFHSNLAGHGEYVALDAHFGGRYQYQTQATFRANRFGGSHLWLESVARFETQPGLLFAGLGHPDSRSGGAGLDPREAAVTTRYSEERFLTLLRSGYSFGRLGAPLQLGATAVYNVRDFGPRTRGGDPSLETVYDADQVIGFEDHVGVVEGDVNVVIDTRDVKGATGRGTYFEAFAGRATGVGGYEFWHHGVELSQYLDLYRGTRVLVLRGVVEGVEGLDHEIPFTELPRLGGPERLRGYRLDRFRDEKAVLGTVEYHYPVHHGISGSLHFDVGKVEHDYSAFFASNHWQAGFGGGFIFRSRDQVLFTLDLAYGEGLQFYLTTDPLRAFARRDTEL